MFLLVSLILLVLGVLVPPGLAATLLLVLSQATLLAGCIRERHATTVGAFMFMSFLFFGMRPLYLEIEHDTVLLSGLFRIGTSPRMLQESLAWAVAGLWLLVLGCRLQRLVGRWEISRLQEASARIMDTTNYGSMPSSMYWLTFLFQILTLAFMAFISRLGRNIYASSLGAYAWDFPMVLQGVQVIGVVIIAERWRIERSFRSMVFLVVSFGLLALTSWFARDVTLFRGAYLTPLIAAGLCLLIRLRGRVNYAWLILPIVLLLPIFRALGETRSSDNSQLQGEISGRLETAVSPASYWHFFDSSGDINIYDTFVAALQYEPAYRPYVFSWLYAPLHVVPRALWPGKPDRGTLQDLAYTNGAPYSPGLAGFFVGDGGPLWMLGCMFTLGWLLSWIDMRILKMPPGLFKACAYGIVTVNALYLTRFFLWQSLWQTFYFLLPCWFLARYVFKQRPGASWGGVSGENLPGMPSRLAGPVPPMRGPGRIRQPIRPPNRPRPPE